MIGVYAVIAAGLIGVGIALGILVIVSVGIHREKKTGRRLTAISPGPVATAARAVTSLGVYRASATWK